LSEQRKYRSWTAQQKLEIVLAGMRGDRSVRDVCRELAIVLDAKPFLVEQRNDNAWMVSGLRQCGYVGATQTGVEGVGVVREDACPRPRRTRETCLRLGAARGGSA
jgi:hypothetical protein